MERHVGQFYIRDGSFSQENRLVYYYEHLTSVLNKKGLK